MQVSLKYILDVGLQLNLAILTRVADFNQGTLDMLGLEVVSFNFAIVSGKIELTILLETNALGDSLWKTAEQLQYATRNLFRDVFALRLPAFVTAEEPVVTGAPPPPPPPDGFGAGTPICQSC